MRMSSSVVIQLIFLFTILTSSSSLNNIHKCSQEQSDALLLFKQILSSINNSNNDYCRGWLGSDYYPIMKNWNTESDCCDWNGVTCNHSTGDVTGLDLSCGMLQGTIHSNTSLFHLPHLQRLNLAFNDFTDSQIPHGIGMLSNTLTHFNISKSGFRGQVPSEISLLYKLVSLDLSSIFDSVLEFDSHVFINLLQNATVLERLSLELVNLSSLILPAYLNISSSLRLLNLRMTGLQGKLPHYIFNLQYLETLDLSKNYNLTGPLPEVITSTSSFALKHLFLSSTNLSSEIPDSFGHFKSLIELDLSFCGLVGALPKSLTNLRHLNFLVLSSNKLNGTLPSWLFTLPSLEHIWLDYNMFSGNLPFKLFSMHSLKALSLTRNQLSGRIDVLEQGPVQQTFQQLTNLTFLDLSYNDFRGDWELDTSLSSLTNLKDLILSYSGLSVMENNANYHLNHDFRYLELASCNIKLFPESLRAMKSLQQLDLSNNKLHGIPDWVGEIGGSDLYYLNLSNNFITHLPQHQWVGMRYMYVQSNMIQGPFPLSICYMNNLLSLDMSNNSFDGVIPECIGNVTSYLRILNLQNNHFQGVIPNVFKNCGNLEGFLLNGNQFEGEVPSSLSNCEYLEVLDVGNNHLNDTFPAWLGDIPNLQALVLKSNNFHGPIVTSSSHEHPFQSLQVLDLSHNVFVGQLPETYFWNSKAMKNLVKMSTEPEYLIIDGMYYSLSITVKGVRQDFPRIFIHYTIIDVSSNGFQGEIPNMIGSLNSLKALNLSHNNFNGRIPHALGNLSEIESLDLSWNQLIGEIPRNLAGIKGLQVLNLSQNHLVGPIPKGEQFNTFPGYSFGGNSGLCGFPLPKHCKNLNSPQIDTGGGDDDDDDEGEYTWKVVLLGYGCGTLIGLVSGYLMLSTGKPKWFNAFSDSIEHKISKRRNKRRLIYIGK